MNLVKKRLPPYLRRGALSLTVLLLLSPSILQVQARDIYVSPSGSDTTGDGSQVKPYREIRKALTVVSPGDAILAADGQYKGFDIDGVTATASLPITIRAQGTNAVVLKTTDRSDNRDSMFIDASSHIVIDGLRSFNANRAALRIEGSSYITVQNCTFGSCSNWGILTGHCDYLLIQSNECYGSILEHGIYVGNSGDWPTVRANRSHDNSRCGIHMNADLSCGGDGIISGALVENNVIWNNGTGGGGGINMDGVQDSTIRNNLLYNNHATGITCYQTDGAEGPKGQKILHNTVIMASNGRYALHFGQTAGMNYVRNNMLYNLNPNRGGLTYYSDAEDVPNVDSDYNVFGTEAPYVATDDWANRYTLSQWQQSRGRELHSFVSTQSVLFAGYTTNNYHLASNSPAIDAGCNTAGVLKDAEGGIRPAGLGFDIGCYESTKGGYPDSDLDGMADWKEYVAGTDPTDPASRLAVSDIRNLQTSLAVEWPSVSNRFYALRGGSNLLMDLTEAVTNHVMATPPLNTCTVFVGQAASFFYRVIVEQ